jgi:hypothetical protein
MMVASLMCFVILCARWCVQASEPAHVTDGHHDALKRTGEWELALVVCAHRGCRPVISQFFHLPPYSDCDYLASPTTGGATLEQYHEPPWFHADRAARRDRHHCCPYRHAPPDVTDSEKPGAFTVLNLEALVRMKLTSFRDKDRTHLA